MSEIIEKLLEAVELGKIDQKSPYPPTVKRDGWFARTNSKGPRSRD